MKAMPLVKRESRTRDRCLAQLVDFAAVPADAVVIPTSDLANLKTFPDQPVEVRGHRPAACLHAGFVWNVKGAGIRAIEQYGLHQNCTADV